MTDALAATSYPDGTLALFNDAIQEGEIGAESRLRRGSFGENEDGIARASAFGVAFVCSL